MLKANELVVNGANRYRVVRRVGEGGMGEGYEARVESFAGAGRPAERVFLKVVTFLFPSYDLKTEGRHAYLDFLRAVKEAVDGGGNQFCIDFHDVFVSAPHNRYVIVQNWMTAGSLERKLEEGPPYASASERLTHAKVLAYAIKGLHGLGIVHLDLKPLNIQLLKVPGANDRVVVTDLDGSLVRIGRARARGAVPVSLGPHALGTPLYMSPEVYAYAEGRLPVSAITSRADVFSLGVMLWQVLLHNVFPYPSDIDAEVLVQQGLERRLRRARDVRDHLVKGGRLQRADYSPEHLDLLDQMLRFDPAARPSSEQVYATLVGGDAVPLQLECGGALIPVTPGGTRVSLTEHTLQAIGKLAPGSPSFAVRFERRGADVLVSAAGRAHVRLRRSGGREIAFGRFTKETLTRGDSLVVSDGTRTLAVLLAR